MIPRTHFLSGTLVALAAALWSSSADAQPPPAGPPGDTPPADSPPADAPPADSPPADAPPTDTPPAEPPPTDVPPTEPPPAEPPPAEPPPGELTPQPIASQPPIAAQPDAAIPPQDEPVDVDHLIAIDLGLRTQVVPSAGFDPFADSNLLAQLTLGARATPLRVEPFSLGIVAEYDVGNRSDTVRGAESSLTLHRVGGGLVADFAIVRHLHAFARVTAAAIYAHGSITEAGLDRPLVSNAWTWSLDATGGLAVLFGTVGGRDDDEVGFWLAGEFGYGFAGEMDMVFAPEEDPEDPRRFGSVTMPPLDPSGFLNRFTLGISF